MSANARWPTILPRPEHVDQRLDQILRRGSFQTGGNSDFDRLMLMLTRSCEFRCSYCLVSLTEDGHGEPNPGVADPATFADIPAPPRGDLTPASMRRAIDLLVRSARDRIGVQTFGGEPTRNWSTLVEGLHYLFHHPERQGRQLEILVTTNGYAMDAARLAELKQLPVIVQLSLDGDAHGQRFRRPLTGTADDAYAQCTRAVSALQTSGLRWFMNATLPPAAADEAPARLQFARDAGVPGLQVNYATGVRWSEGQTHAWLEGLQHLLFDHHENPGSVELYNWRNNPDPVPLCADLIADVDGQVYHVGAVFHEKRFPTLRRTYRRGHIDTLSTFQGLRVPLKTLWDLTEQALTDDPERWETFQQNVRLGAATDLVVQFTRKRLGLDASGRAARQIGATIAAPVPTTRRLPAAPK
ncbi:MAG: hypothetical protein RLZZ383_1184 [Pseudomonadota bacterium]